MRSSKMGAVQSTPSKTWAPIAQDRVQLGQVTVVDVLVYELLRLAAWECWRQLNWKCHRPHLQCEPSSCPSRRQRDSTLSATRAPSFQFALKCGKHALATRNQFQASIADVRQVPQRFNPKVNPTLPESIRSRPTSTYADRTCTNTHFTCFTYEEPHKCVESTRLHFIPQIKSVPLVHKNAVDAIQAIC